jgi:hypothetical protein
VGPRAGTRPRDPWTREQAIALLREQTGEAFDHGCVALERVLAREREALLAVAV